MLTICWFYCIPFAKGLFFALSPLLFLFSLFMLKRGIRQSRPLLRQAAFLLMFLAALKLFTVDIYFLKDRLCGLFAPDCNATGFKILQAGGLVALTLTGLLLAQIYRSFIRNRRQAVIASEQMRLKCWSNLSIFLVLGLIFWLAAPWAGFLTVGHVPKLFMEVPWQYLAIMNVVVLLISFWKLEDCSWTYNPADKSRKAHSHRVWTAKDTLWLSAILFLITLVFSYASHDVLSGTTPHNQANIRMEDLDISRFGARFRLPGE